MKVFSLNRFVHDRNIPLRSRLRALLNGWPQWCNGKTLEEVRKVYKILPEWVEEKKENQPK